MNKKIFITNGMARCGKDTFATYLNEFIPTLKYSSIDKVKEIITLCGWDGGKTERDRKFMSDFKMLTSAYSDMPFKAIEEKVSEFLKDDIHEVMLIDIREPKEIERAKDTFNAETILVKNDRVDIITSNDGDAGVFDYEYDYIIENNGTLDEFKENISIFVDEIILRCNLQGDNS